MDGRSVIILCVIYMYDNLEPQESGFSKIRRSLYLIVTISLLNHTMSTTYSIMSFKE